MFGLDKSKQSTKEEQDPGHVRACLELKKKHDACFYRWMREKFLPGTATTDDCKAEWQEYEACVTKKLDALGLSHLKRAPGQKPDIDVFKLVLKEDEDTLPNTGPAQSASK